MKNNNPIQRWHLWISIAALAVLGFLLSQDALARLAWRKYHRPAVALALNRGNAELGMRLGDYRRLT